MEISFSQRVFAITDLVKLIGEYKKLFEIAEIIEVVGDEFLTKDGRISILRLIEHTDNLYHMLEINTVMCRCNRIQKKYFTEIDIVLHKTHTKRKDA